MRYLIWIFVFQVAMTQAVHAQNYQGLWWKSGGTEAGWGLSIAQPRTSLFVTWFTYDHDGNGLWLTMWGNRSQPGIERYAGTLHWHADPHEMAYWDEGDEIPNPADGGIGEATLIFTAPDRGTFTFTVNGITQSKAIERYVLSPSSARTTCAEGGVGGAPLNYQDIWWRAPAGSEFGGVGIAHQGDMLFATWFGHHPKTGKMEWLAMTNGVRGGNGKYSGALYRTTGPAFDASPWDPAAVTVTPVGTATFDFRDSTNGSFVSTVDGVSVSRPIVRFLYWSGTSVCR